MFTNFVKFQAASMISLVTSAHCKENSPEIKAKIETEHFYRKPSDLPLYTPLHVPKSQINHINEKPNIVYKTIEDGISFVRSEIQLGWNNLSELSSPISEYANTTKMQVLSTVDYLNQPQNFLPRVGAIAIGGLSGLIFAARGGFIKKIMYISAGAGAMASFCYPRQTEQFAQDVLYEARRGYSITYNFIKGVKPGEGAMNEPVNKFPASLTDIKFLIYDLYDEACDVLFPSKKKSDD